MKKGKSQKIVVIMPVRMGSKRLKNKNILIVRGLPMFVLVATEALRSKYNLELFISSESNEVKKICGSHNLNFIKRPKNLSLDHTEKQEVVVHAVKYLKKNNIIPKIVISLQGNSPEFNVQDLDRAINFFETKVYVGKPIKEVFSVNKDNIQNGAFRILTFKAVFQKTLSTKVGIFFTNYIDVHNKKDYLKVLKKLKNEKN